VFPGDNETTHDHVLFIKDDDIKPNSERTVYLNLKFLENVLPACIVSVTS